MQTLSPWQHLNWGGISFALLMAVFLFACAAATHLLRNSKPKKFKIRHEDREPIDWVSLEPLPAASHVPRDFFYAKLPATPPADWLPSDEAKLQGMLKAAPLRLVPRKHECTIDFERSKLMPMPDGAILAQCCVSGCDIVIRLGSNIAHVVVESRQEEGAACQSQ